LSLVAKKREEEALMTIKLGLVFWMTMHHT